MANALAGEYRQAQPRKQTLWHFIEILDAIAGRSEAGDLAVLLAALPLTNNRPIVSTWLSESKAPSRDWELEGWSAFGPHRAFIPGIEVHPMIAFCTHCWAEIDDALNMCPRCGEDLNSDSRSYEQKLVAALGHPLPEARVRICWLIGENRISLAVPDLMKIAECDPDLFVRRAALEALAVLHDPQAAPLLEAISKSGNRFLAAVARRSLGAISLPTGENRSEWENPFCRTS